MKSSPHHVVAAILVRDERVLLCHRRDDRSWYPGVWDLPGGHMEPTETVQEALARECHEELGIDVRTLEDPLTVVTGELTLSLCVVGSWAGEPTNTAPEEHQAIDWFAVADLAGLPLADARLGPLLTDLLRHGVTKVRPPSSPLPEPHTDGRSR